MYIKQITAHPVCENKREKQFSIKNINHHFSLVRPATFQINSKKSITFRPPPTCESGLRFFAFFLATVTGQTGRDTMSQPDELDWTLTTCQLAKNRFKRDDLNWCTQDSQIGPGYEQ
jgi:hypothetical protein